MGIGRLRGGPARAAAALLAGVALLVLVGRVPPASAVVGGRPAQPGSFPYVADVLIGGSFGCSGTLVAPQWVLTAGHCGSITGSLTEGLVPTPAGWPPQAYTVQLGSVYASGAGGERHSVARLVVDRDYLVTNGVGNDVTLLELDTPSKVKPMLIAPAEPSLWRAGVPATIAGFGTTSESASGPPPQMRFAHVPMQSDDACARAYPHGLDEVENDGAFDAQTMVCAGYPQGGTDTCQGDSGGPLLAPAAGGELLLVGATSFGRGCAEAGHPGIYALLAQGPIRSFIASVVPQAFAASAAAGHRAASHHRDRRHRHRHRHHHRGHRHGRHRA